MSKFVAIILTIIVLIYIIAFAHQRENTIRDISALNDSLSTWRTKGGLFMANITAIEANNIYSLSLLSAKDSTVKKLEKEVEYYKKKSQRIIYIETISEVEKIVPTYIDSINPVIYKFNYLDYWISLYGISMPDSTSFNLQVKNEYAVAFPKIKGIEYVEIKCLNPYTSVNNMQYFKLPDKKPKRFGLGLQLGYSVQYKNKNFHVSPSIGIGVQYDLIQF